MALIAAHLNAEAGHSGGDDCSVAIGIQSPSPPTSTPPSPLLPVPNTPYGFCGRETPCLLTLLQSRFTREPVWPSGKALGW